jgi:carbon monoxide dehydrogenase subunit G
MQLENTFTVPLRVDQAWPVLMDVERVLGCVPGATLESVDGDEVRARMKVKLGPILMTYRGVGRFVEKDEQAKRVVIEASGKDSKGAGTASATVRTSLHERGDETEVHVLTELKLTGKPAQFGRGAIQEVTSTLIGRFADSLSVELSAGPSGDDETAVDELRAPQVPAVAAGPATLRVADAPASKHAAAEEDHLDLMGAMGPVVKRTAAKAAGAVLLIVLCTLLVRYLIIDR